MILGLLATFFTSAAGRQVFGLLQSILDNRRIELLNNRKWVAAQVESHNSARTFFSSNPIWSYIAGVFLLILLLGVEVPTKIMPYLSDKNVPITYVYNKTSEGGSFLFWSWGAGEEQEFKRYPRSTVVVFAWELYMLSAAAGFLFGGIKRR